MDKCELCHGAFGPDEQKETVEIMGGIGYVHPRCLEEKDSPRDYLIWSFKHKAWWRPLAQGYTNDLDEAGRYTADEAGKHTMGDIMMNTQPVHEAIVKREGAPRCHPYASTEFTDRDMQDAFNAGYDGDPWELDRVRERRRRSP